MRTLSLNHPMVIQTHSPLFSLYLGNIIGYLKWRKTTGAYTQHSKKHSTEGNGSP